MGGSIRGRTRGAIAVLAWLWAASVAARGQAVAGASAGPSPERKRPVLVRPSIATDLTSATVTFQTRPACFSQVRYWSVEVSDKLVTTRTPAAVEDHAHALTGLKPDTSHSVQILLSYEDGAVDEFTARLILTFNTTRTAIEMPKIRAGGPAYHGPGGGRDLRLILGRRHRPWRIGGSRAPAGVQPSAEPCRYTELLTTPSNPADEVQFHDRLSYAICWIDGLQAKGVDVTEPRKRISSIRTAFFTNRIRAARSLDALARDLERIGPP